ncbi:hypothetical protein O3M35_006324 [Rhynocoris fuscipes]|uniref:Secreted protein n=1 Tax=Rhynocoris fuscipes TaxID=488301 RepID=A0AAW1DCX3_9HEMI
MFCFRSFRKVVFYIFLFAENPEINFLIAAVTADKIGIHSSAFQEATQTNNQPTGDVQPYYVSKKSLFLFDLRTIHVETSYHLDFWS